VALLPRQGRIIQWFTLAVALVTFGLTFNCLSITSMVNRAFNLKSTTPGSPARPFVITWV